MNRRDLMTAAACAAMLGSGRVFGQSTAIPRIALLDPGNSPRIAGFIAAMQRLGYTDGRNVAYLRRTAEGQNRDFRRLAAELAALQPDVIVTASGQATRAAMASTQSIPIVFVSVGDALNQGIIQSLSRPGANVTGSSFVDTEISPKRLEILHELVPSVRRVGVLFDPANPQSELLLAGEQKAATAFGIDLDNLAVTEPGLFESSFAKLRAGRADAIHLLGSIVFSSHREKLVGLAATHRLPAMYQNADFVRVGGLAAYGPSFAVLEAHAAACVDKILKGAKPGDLPVEQPTKFELVINLNTAKALGITVPQTILARADEVIE